LTGAAAAHLRHHEFFPEHAMNKQVQTPEQPVGNRIDERAERLKHAANSAVYCLKVFVYRAVDIVEECVLSSS
jgi:hypothetical protein